MTSEQILLKIDGLEEQITDLKDEYYSITPSCGNEKCGWYSKSDKGGCQWTHEITRCKDYIPEEE